jgi:amino acid adenylation domain-containing protein
MGDTAIRGQVAVADSLIAETIAERFERQAAATPDAPAVLVPERIISYRELNAMAEAVAERIEALYPSGQSAVAVATDDTVLSLAAMLGASKLARIFVPLDMAFPESYLAETITDARASLIIADQETSALANRIKGEAEVVSIDSRDAPATRTTANRRKSAAADAAYILYTSGSTGKAKGVVLSHEFLLRYVNVWSNRFGIGAGDRMSLLFSCNWGTGMHNTFTALLCGACVCPFEIRSKGVSALSKWLNDYGITVLVTTSSLFRTWMTSLGESERFPTLRLIRNSAEPLYREDIARAAAHFDGNCQIVHSLGTTETGTVAIHALAFHSDLEDGVLPVGYAAPGIEIRLETETGDPAQQGEPGEIVLFGRHLALGYWNNPALTDAVFRRDPTDPAVRSYRSGDFGRWRSDGQLEFLGRKDRKVKIRGFTIELYEIERALLRIPEIGDASVIVHEDGHDVSRLVAYAVMRAGQARPSTEDLAGRLAEHLPAHMIPSDMIMMDAFPLTVRGKVDRSALPPPPQRNREGKYRAPHGKAEEALAAIWQEVLNMPEIGTDADFYDLGGTSLQAFLIFARISRVLERDLPPTLMLQTRTIAQQAELISRGTQAQSKGRLVTFRKHGRGLPLFVVHGAFGDIMFVRELVRDLKSNRPVYGLQPPALDGNDKVPRRMEAIAADYLAEIRKVQPNGPYFLAGYSFGGIAALEIAQQLARSGERAAFVALIDTIYDSQYEVAGEDAGSRLGRHLRGIRGRHGFSYLAKRAWKTAKYAMTRIRDRMGEFPNELRCLMRKPVPYEKRASFYRFIYVRATHAYRPKTYFGCITVFAAKGKSDWHRARWSSIALGGLCVYEVPADHFDMVWPPHSSLLASYFDAGLDTQT